MGSLSKKNRLDTKKLLKNMRFSLKSKQLSNNKDGNDEADIVTEPLRNKRTMDSISFYKFL